MSTEQSTDLMPDALNRKHFLYRWGSGLGSLALTHLLKGVIRALTDPKAHPDHLLFTGGERREDLTRLIIVIRAHQRVARALNALILNEVPEVAVLLLTNRGLKGDWIFSDF